LRAKTDDCRDFLGRRRTYDTRRLATIAAAPVDEIRRGVVGRSQDIPGADNGAELLDQVFGIQGMTPGRASVRVAIWSVTTKDKDCRCVIPAQAGMTESERSLRFVMIGYSDSSAISA
jgi:hypothetical protein